MAKLSPATRAAWCELLRAVPDARLVIKNSALGNAGGACLLRDVVPDRGVDPERIEWHGASAHDAMLAEYAAIDVVLDTFPYNGGLTTLEALWMGRPVVAVDGTTLISRQSRAILSAIGMPNSARPIPARYVEIAAGLIRDPRDWRRFRARCAAASGKCIARPREVHARPRGGSSRRVEAMVRAGG